MAIPSRPRCVAGRALGPERTKKVSNGLVDDAFALGAGGRVGERSISVGSGIGHRGRESRRDGVPGVSSLVFGTDTLLARGRTQHGRSLGFSGRSCRALGGGDGVPGSAAGIEAAYRHSRARRTGAPGHPESLARRPARLGAHHFHGTCLDRQPDARISGGENGQGEDGTHASDPVARTVRAGP